ncbi:hypothetical protein GOBAR_AA18930 [Gossypium barbadense]|uniref:Uncharacterized protein n=1 Tax=Gossypium barbadense TaxID=3634 RepID=A0A2P5XEG5_GOSBA|nr:hypothetical protein GOBAR_AA18930 [Gossypium barbadense]
MLEKREKEIFILTKKLEDDSSESLFGVKNLTAQENNLLSEKETLQAKKALLKENFAFESDEASNQVQRLIDEANALQQQLESPHIQKAKLELQFERKKQKSSERLNEIENQKLELKQMVEDLQRDLETKGEAAGAMHAAVKKRDQTVVLLPGERNRYSGCYIAVAAPSETATAENNGVKRSHTDNGGSRPQLNG